MIFIKLKQQLNSYYMIDHILCIQARLDKNPNFKCNIISSNFDIENNAMKKVELLFHAWKVLMEITKGSLSYQLKSFCCCNLIKNAQKLNCSYTNLNLNTIVKD
jgi:hypothetical protein